MRVIFMGTPDFAVPTLQSLINSKHEVCAVVTQPDRPKGRHGQPVFSPVKETAVAAGLPVLQPAKLREEGVYEALAAYQPDVIVVAAFGQIVPERILNLPPYGCINVHGSLLPKYRGASPIQWAIAEGEKETGITIMQMAKGLDTGDMLLQKAIPLTGTETGGSLFDELAGMGGPLVLEVLDGLAAGTITPVPQNDAEATYVTMLTRESGAISWREPAAVIERKVRAFNPWPACYTELEGQTLKIWAAHVEDRDANALPGAVVDTAGGVLRVQTGEHILAVTELQLAGKKRMDTASFLRGFAVKPGTRLGEADS